ILDFVPNHVARQYYSDARETFVDDLGQHDDITKAFDIHNNFYYIPGRPLELHFGAKQEDFEYSEFPAKVTGNNRFDATPDKNDWYETIKLNYGVDYANGGVCHFDPIPDTWIKMRDILLFWAAKGVDAFRCDMAEMVPVEFWHWVIPQVKKEHELLFIAEVYNPGEYRNYIYSGHFDYLYDKVGLYDTLRAVMCRQQPASNITASWQAVEGIQPYMLNFLENHDEQRIASDFFAANPKVGIAGLMVSALMNTNPFMLYFGQELGEKGMDEEGFSGCDGRTTIFDYWSVETVRNWINKGAFDGGRLTDEQKQLRETYRKVLNIAASEPIVAKGNFFDLMYANKENPYLNPSRQYVFLRKYEKELLLVVANFDKASQTVRINIPKDAFEALGIEDNKAAKVTDLMSGEQSVGTLTESWPYQLTLPPYSGRVIKFAYE
ncbi:alpha-glucosidase C-terminal domain-containing protein, partial [Parabacteroides sp. OttesenSCG-928-N08]|nr:alpha-glucosidase C-terminal domain-containing protein [Parabacteroides sp. OttesenSCG-928-N08]